MKQTCPNCNSQAFKRNGYTRHGKQNHRCLECGRQFSLEPYITSTQASELPTEEDLIEGILVKAKDS